jgi:hypothetical protein
MWAIRAECVFTTIARWCLRRSRAEGAMMRAMVGTLLACAICAGLIGLVQGVASAGAPGRLDDASPAQDGGAGPSEAAVVDHHPAPIDVVTFDVAAPIPLAP